MTLTDRQERAYERFKASLKKDAQYWDYETKEELRELMTGANYRHKKEKGVAYTLTVSAKQVDFAWDYLKDSVIQEILDKYTVHTYHKQIIKRANQNQTIKGKAYRKGQFLPKDK